MIMYEKVDIYINSPSENLTTIVFRSKAGHDFRVVTNLRHFVLNPEDMSVKPYKFERRSIDELC